MNTLDPNVIIEISSKISAIDERTRALQAADQQAQANADHRHRNIMAAIENFVPRREIESENKAIREYAEQMAKETQEHCDINREAVIARVTVVEESLSEIHTTAKGVHRWFLGVVGSGVVAGGYYLIAHLLHIKVFWQS